MNQKGNSLLIVFLIVILIGIVIGGYYLWQKSSEEQELPIQPIKSIDVEDKEISITPSSTSTSDKLSGWITYTNDNFDYTISYPKEFNLSDSCYNTQTGELMEYSESPKWLVIIDRNMDDKFPYCESDFPQMEVIIKAYPQEIDINERMEESDTDIEDELTIGDNTWARQIMTEKSEFDGAYITNYYLNKDGKGYQISVRNDDNNGTHDKIIDQIIETFNMIETNYSIQGNEGTGETLDPSDPNAQIDPDFSKDTEAILPEADL